MRIFCRGISQIWLSLALVVALFGIIGNPALAQQTQSAPESMTLPPPVAEFDWPFWWPWPDGGSTKVRVYVLDANQTTQFYASQLGAAVSGQVTYIYEVTDETVGNEQGVLFSAEDPESGIEDLSGAINGKSVFSQEVILAYELCTGDYILSVSATNGVGLTAHQSITFSINIDSTSTLSLVKHACINFEVKIGNDVIAPNNLFQENGTFVAATLKENKWSKSDDMRKLSRNDDADCINIYVVKDARDVEDGAIKDHKGYGFPNDNAIVDDSSNMSPTLVAHEIGHVLWLWHVSGYDPDRLMYPSATGTLLSRKEASTANDWASRLLPTK